MKVKMMVCALVVMLAVSSVGFAQLEAYTGKPMQGFPASAESQVTLSNWTLQPYNKWAFRNAGILPSLMVARGEPIHSFGKKPVFGLDNLSIIAGSIVLIKKHNLFINSMTTLIGIALAGYLVFAVIFISKTLDHIPVFMERMWLGIINQFFSVFHWV